MEFVKILGAPSDSATTQTHEFEVADGGSVFLLITLQSTEPALSRIEAIRGAVNFFHHEIKREELDFEGLKESVAKSFVTPQFHTAILYVKDELIYVFALGETEVLLLRGSQLVPLVTGSTTVKAASGYIKPKDGFILATGPFTELVTVTELTAYLEKGQLKALEDDTATRIQEAETRGACGFAFVAPMGMPKVESILEEAIEFPDERAGEPSENEIQDGEFEEEVAPNNDRNQEQERDFEQEEEEDQPLTAQPPSPPAYLQDSDQAKRRFFAHSDDVYEAHGRSKRLAYVGVILIIFLAISVYFGTKARKAKDEAAQVQAVIAQAQEALSEARTISSVNKARARDLIVEAREQVLGVKTDEKYPELSSVKDALTESLGEVAGVYEVTPTVFSDLSLISQETRADSLSLSDGVIRILSQSDKKVVTIELPGKRTQTVSGGTSLSDVRSIAAYAKIHFVLSTSGVYSVTNTATKQFDLPADAQNLLFSAFAGNIYMVDRGSNKIYRYAGDGVSFGEKKDWLTEGTEVDLSKARDMGIDGSIWVYSESGKLTKFTLGNAQTVTLKGLPQTPSASARFFTDSDTNYLYLLDPEAQSLYVFEKAGDLLATYSNGEFSNAKELIVSEQNNIMIVSTGSKLLSLPTKHIK